MIGKWRASTKILLGAALLAAVGYVGLRVVPAQLILREKFAPIEPGEVNLIGVDTSKGYYIVVANQVAQLVFGEQQGFEAPDKQALDAGDQKLRIPLRDMLRALQGDPESVGRFVMVLNKISDSELPAYPIVWSNDELRRALDGDKALSSKLVSDLGIELDGSPSTSLRMGAVQEGIVIESTVALEVPGPKGKRKVEGRIREEYQPRFLMELDTRLAEKSNLTRDMIRAYYIDAARELQENPKTREDVRRSLTSRIDPSRLEDLAVVPQKLLDSIDIIVTDQFVDDASYSEYQASDGKPKYDMTLVLNEEGRRRLWQYSAKHRGRQLLVVWDGIAIAAPRIQNEIPFSEVQIRQIPDQGLVEDTIDAIKRLSQERKSKP